MQVEKRKTHLIGKMAAAYSSFNLFNLVISLTVILVLNVTDGETVEENLCHKSCEIQKFDEVMKVLRFQELSWPWRKEEKSNILKLLEWLIARRAS